MRRARAIFDSADVDKSGDVSRPELVPKLKGDDELERLLGIRDIKGDGPAIAKALSKVRPLAGDGDRTVAAL